MSAQHAAAAELTSAKLAAHEQRRDFGLGGEDVFTNRDANHAALPGRRQTWRGFRKFCSTIRNDSDFRTSGGKGEALDKSIHQFQALEMPWWKDFASCGQHKYARR